MRFSIRMIPIATLMLTASMLFGQQTKSAPATTTVTTTTSPAIQTQVADTTPLSGYEIRNEFSKIVSRHPRELAMLLAIEPGLLNNDDFLAGYPEVARFVAAHPEIRKSPRVYVADFAVPGQHRDNALQQVLEPFFIVFGFGLFLFTLTWLIRTFIEQRRWSRLSRVQSEVHGKILDRFATSEELLQYIKTPAGSKFLESAPIPLRAEEPVQNAPVSRILSSIQLGLIVAAGALGAISVSTRLDAESAQGLFALGVIALSVGIGFVVSAIVSLVLSRRLGLWQVPGSAPGTPDEAGLMR